jgi:hypothetical protein
MMIKAFMLLFCVIDETCKNLLAISAEKTSQAFDRNAFEIALKFVVHFNCIIYQSLEAAKIDEENSR